MDAQSIRDLFQAFAPVALRRMFGGHGLFHDGLMFALEADGEIYLKVDDRSEPDFIAAGSSPFVYETRHRKVTMRYWRAPEAALDDPEIMAGWAREACRAARDAANAKKARAPARKRRRRDEKDVDPG